MDGNIMLDKAAPVQGLAVVNDMKCLDKITNEIGDKTAIRMTCCSKFVVLCCRTANCCVMLNGATTVIKFKTTLVLKMSRFEVVMVVDSDSFGFNKLSNMM